MGRLSDWMAQFLESDTIIGQIQRTMVLQVTIFLIPYTLFFVFWIVLDWGLLDSLVVPSITFSFALVAYQMWVQQVRTEGLSLGGGPVSLSIYWNESCVEQEANIMLSWRSLEEKDLNKIRNKMDEAYLKPPGRLNNPYDSSQKNVILNRAAYETLDKELLGRYFTQINCYRAMWSPLYSDIRWKNGVYIHDFPRDKTFRKVPDQLMSYKGQVFLTAAAKVSVVFLYWDQELQPCPIFLVTTSPEHARIIQLEGIKLKPTASMEDLKEAASLRSKHEAMPLAVRLRNLSSQLSGVREGWEDVEERADGIVGRFVERRERIHSFKKYGFLKSKKLLLYLAVGVLAILLGLWLFGVI